MKASTLFLGFTLVLLAAVLAGLWQTYGPHTTPHQRPPAVSPNLVEAPKRAAPAPPPVSQPEPTPPALEEGVRSVYPGGRPSAGLPPQPETSPPAITTPPVPEPIAPTNPIPAPPPAADRSAVLTPPGASNTSDPAPADARVAGESIDINSASAEALNELGAGKIAKTIIANRPYTAPDDLVTRRVLKRKDYEAIKSRIVVR